jgi:hypothetical protein
VYAFYGHGSSIALVLFFGLFAMRALSSQRRHRGQRGGAPSTASFTDPTSRGPVPDDVGRSPADIRFTGIPAGWLIDPSGRHERRYWSGTEWTEHVTDGGVPGIDPPPHNPGRETPS